MKATPVEIEKYLKYLSETPERIAEAVAGLEEASLHLRPDHKAWSVIDILAHLRACADLWTYSIYAMLAEKDPELADINERKWAKITLYASASFPESFQMFSSQRKNLLRVLKSLPFDSWERPAIILGRRHTVFSQTRRMAKHEHEHVGQIEELLQEDTQRQG